MDSKVCSCCKKDKSIDNFVINNKKTGQRRSECKACRNEKAKTYDAYKNTKIRARRLENKKRKLIQRYKMFCGCRFCGIKIPEVLDLHHINPSDKLFNPSCMTKERYDVIRNELRKCAVICANHHRMIHAGIISL